MTGLVIDASVTLSWIFEDEPNVYAESVLKSLRNRSVIVPAHWILEVVNGLLSAERKGRITTADSTRGLVFLQALRIGIDEKTTESAKSQTFSLARTHRLTIYDAAYLELCLREGLELASLDADLIDACKKAGGKLASGSV